MSKFYDFFSYFRTSALLLLMSYIFIVEAVDTSCVLIGYDVLNLTKAAYWEIDSSDKTVCLNKTESCKFYFSLCKPLPAYLTGGNKCANNAVCTEQPPNPTNSTPSFQGLGSELILKNFQSTDQFYANYSKGGPYHKPDNSTCTTSTILHFFCKPDRPWIPESDLSKGSKVPSVNKIVYDDKLCQYQISMEYAGACLHKAVPIQPGMSAGSVLIIMFICAFSVYVIGGMTYNHVQGALGREKMPHLDFWEELPKNIQAGCTFTFQMLTCQEIPTQSPTYEQL